MAGGNDTYRIVEIEIPSGVSKERLDRYLARDSGLDITRSRVQKLIDEGLILVNGKPALHNHKLKGGEAVTVKIPPPRQTNILPEDIPIDVVFEDDYFLVVNKPAGMVTHPAAGHYTGTLVNAVLKYTESLSGLQGIERAGVVHRLDKNTSGLIMIAKNDKIHLALQTKLKEQAIIKVYYALVCGHMKEEKGTIELPIGRSIKDRKKMTVTHLNSRSALTEYELLERYKLYDLLKIHLKTGRTHQIRVHFSHLGHPVFGDPDYGGRIKWHRGVFAIDKPLAQKALELMPRQALHAKSLELAHPVTGENILVDSDLPDDFSRLLELLRESL
ncbi:MAG TPA: RluA family pseudouridine synthase [candidate division Zixibacteria bacterium]|nr:RluA family pseudouridine synthase [candidate division Zixibacteria bacterium]